MKQKVRKSHPVDESETARVVKKVFMTTPLKDLQSYYRNCALTHGTDSYKDLDA